MAKALRLTQIERKEISDSRMLEVAIDLIVERGAEQTTLKDVGEKPVIPVDWRVTDLAIKRVYLISYCVLSGMNGSVS